MSLDDALETLRVELDRIRTRGPDPIAWNIDQVAASKRRVVNRFGPLFAPGAVAALGREEFLGFLRIENNERWSGLDLCGPQMTNDMPLLRQALTLLVDEGEPLAGRLDRIYSGLKPPMVPYLGPGILTPILQVVYPDRYAVLNGNTQAQLRQFGAWAGVPLETSFGVTYEAANGVLRELAQALGVDLWTLDHLWWKLASHRGERAGTGPRLTRAASAGVGAAAGAGVAVAAGGTYAHAHAPGRDRREETRRLVLPSGLSLSMDVAAEGLLRLFREEYAYYDGIPDAEPGRILPIDVLAAAGTIPARVDDIGHGPGAARQLRAAHRAMAARCDPVLGEIPAEADLLESAGEAELQAVGKLLHAAAQAETVHIPLATRVLHRKRRRLLPTLDDAVVDYYLDARGHSDLRRTKARREHAGSVALEVVKAVREDLRACPGEIGELRDRLAHDGFALSPLRVLEALVWMEVEPRGEYRH